jgi:putative tricarboxylic transport membrane protein
MRLNDAVPGVALILFALAVMAYTRTFPATYGQQIGPDLFPIIIGCGLLVCGIILVMSGIASRKTKPLIMLGDWAGDSSAVINVLLVPAAMIFYILASHWLGFVLSSMIILVTLLYRFGAGPVTSISVALVTTLVIQQVFVGVLLVPLPWGLLEPIAW